MKTSQRGIDIIKHFESCRLRAYLDGGGVPTIGWGHTHGVKMGDSITQDEADEIFTVDLKIFEQGVNRLVKVPITQNEFDALVSFSYNCGLDEDTDNVAEGLGDSTLLKRLNEMDYYSAAQEFPKWNRDNGKVVAGLVRRREAERSLFVNG